MYQLVNMNNANVLAYIVVTLLMLIVVTWTVGCTQPVTNVTENVNATSFRVK